MRTPLRHVLADAWAGRLPLWLTYWVLGVGGNLSLFALLLLLVAGPGLGAAGLLWGVYLLSLLWFVFVFGAIWHAAGRYAGPRYWALLARFGVLLGVVRMSGEAFVLAAPEFAARLLAA
ncbi:MAG: hypothetical protein V2J02_21700 [Pseudomonadales bacterium]|jgi:hypothetical protein|nr:hypothetical protein [Pseudomonadales bacterium]